MYHVTQQASQHYACPERMTSAELASGSSSPSSSSTSFTSESPSHGGSPSALLHHAYNAVQNEEQVIAGSATACILTLDSSKGFLRSANLGDSGFLILRQTTPSRAAANSQQNAFDSDKDASRNVSASSNPSSPVTSRAPPRPQEGVFFASTPLQYGFNTPFQIAKLPPTMVQEGSIANTPADAATWECRLRHGDIVVVGTDGLWDNVHNAEIVQLARFIKEKHHTSWAATKDGAAESKTNGNVSIVGKAGSESGELAEEKSFIQVFAHNLVEYTRMCQFSQTKRSPFEREAERYGIHYPGGKVDDVAVVIALVVER